MEKIKNKQVFRFKMVIGMLLMILISMITLSDNVYAESDYRNMPANGLTKPIARLKIYNDNGSLLVTSNDGNSTSSIPVIYVDKGEKLEFKCDNSRSVCHTDYETIVQWDFQLFRDGRSTSVSKAQKAPESIYYPFDTTGTYNAYLCVRADTNGSWSSVSSDYNTRTNYMGLWSQNGQYTVKTPSTGIWWYYTQVKIICEEAQDELESIEVTPDNQYIDGFNKKGNKLKITATYENGEEDTISFSDSDVDVEIDDEDKVKYVDSSGYPVSGDEEGTARITVYYKENGIEKSDTVRVNVSDDKELSKIELIDSNNQTIKGFGNVGKRITVKATYSNGDTKTIDNSLYFYNYDKSIVSSVSSSGYPKSANKAGSTDMKVSYTENGITRDTQIKIIVETDNVAATLSRIDVTPNYQEIIGFGITGQRLKVMATYSSGDPKDVTDSAYFVSRDNNVADITSNKYVKSGNTDKTVIIDISYTEGGITKSTTASVKVIDNIQTQTKSLSKIVVSPTEKTIYGLDKNWCSVTVTAYYTDNSTPTDVTTNSNTIYTSQNDSRAFVSNGRLRSGSQEGNTNIEVKYTENGISSYESIYVKVIDDSEDENIPEEDVELEKIEIVPDDKQTIEGFGEYGDTLKVKAYYTDGSTNYVTEDCDFESDDDDIAYVTSSYKVKSGDEDGTVDITANYKENGITKQDSIKVKVIEEDEEDDSDNDFNSRVSGLRVELQNKDNKVKYLENTEITYYVDYYNATNREQEDVDIVVTFPKTMSVVDADDGNESTTKITWNLETIDPWDTGRFKIVLKCKDASGTKEVEIVARLNQDGDEEDESEVKNLIYEKSASGYHNLYMKGYPDGTFRPENKITRQELAVALVRLFDLNYVGDNYYNGYSVYNDVTPEKCWGYNEIMIATNVGLFSGYADGTFRPEAPITKAEFLAIIAKRMEVASKETLTLNFPEIKNYWASNEIEQLYRLKLILNSDLVTKNITQSITRAEVVNILNRVNYRGPLKSGRVYFRDVSSYYWAYSDIQEAAIEHGYIINISGEESER
ncbi:MAG: hypothetical protein A2Y24_02240 [Clostridiales bacterium GWE2_32_10]|nr:MAG: hypothetical protein A2Y24_02240 [Clostridiales bacterium GWE2_32_10]